MKNYVRFKFKSEDTMNDWLRDDRLSVAYAGKVNATDTFIGEMEDNSNLRDASLLGIWDIVDETGKPVSNGYCSRVAFTSSDIVEHLEIIGEYTSIIIDRNVLAELNAAVETANLKLQHAVDEVKKANDELIEFLSNRAEI